MTNRATREIEQEYLDALGGLDSVWRNLKINLPQLPPGHTVNLRWQLEMNALIDDIQILSVALISSHRELSERYEDSIHIVKEGRLSELFEIFKTTESHVTAEQVFAVNFKMVVMQIRALQDSILRILRNLQGKTSGLGTRMAPLLKKNVDHPLKRVIYEKIPDYFSWFEHFRNLRNEVKYGLCTSPGFYLGRQLVIQLNTRKGFDNKNGRTIAIDKELSLEDLVSALRYSTSLVGLAKDIVKTDDSREVDNEACRS